MQGGRTAMQSMLRQFAGLEVDWAYGRVRQLAGSEWELVTLADGFWRDMTWWLSAVRACACVPLRAPEAGVAALTGTDASDHGAGELAWIDGGRDPRGDRMNELCLFKPNTLSSRSSDSVSADDMLGCSARIREGRRDVHWPHKDSRPNFVAVRIHFCVKMRADCGRRYSTVVLGQNLGLPLVSDES